MFIAGIQPPFNARLTFVNPDASLPHMIWVGILAAVSFLMMTGALFIWLSRSSQSHLYSGFKLLQENFESLQRNLMQLQKSFEDRQSVHLKDMHGKLEQNLKEGFRHFELIQSHLKQAELQLKDLNVVGKSVNDLNSLLRMPHLRGSFGEAILEQLLSDLVPANQFELQYQITPGSTERVDAIIRYPNAVLPIDSKFPREKILPLFDTSNPELIAKAQKELQEIMRGLAKDIKQKYIHPEHGTTEMALLFLPSETIYFEVIKNVKLFDDLARMKVFVVSPNTLAITLHSISISRKYYEMARGVETTLMEVKKAETHFSNFESRFEEVGIQLQRAQNAFNTASTHLSRYESAVTRLLGQNEENLSPPSLPS